MHRCPFTLIRVWATTPEREIIYARPLWLPLFGLQRNGGLREASEGYLQRWH